MGDGLGRLSGGFGAAALVGAGAWLAAVCATTGGAAAGLAWATDMVDGSLLRAVRESQGLELKQIARRTRINLAYLEAIESDDFAALPAMVYVRGFVAEIAKCLRLDPIQVAHTYVRRVKRSEAGDRA